MTDQELDRMMRRVLLDAVRLDGEGEEEEAPPVFAPSLRHRRQVRAMLADPLGWSRRRERPVWRQALGRAAAFALVCTLFFGSVMAVSPTARAAVVRWAVEWTEYGVTYRYTGEQNTGPMPRYEITALPEGFVEVERIEELSFVDIVYENQDGDVIWFDYGFMQRGALANFVTEDAEAFDVVVGQFDGVFFQALTPGNLSTLTWIDPDANIQFAVDGCFELSDFLHIAESVSLCKTPN